MSLTSFIQKFGSSSRQQRQRGESLPLLLNSGVRFPYGAFRFKIQVGKNIPFEIHASSDLKYWQTIVADTAPEDVVEYVDSEAHKFSYRFYRAQVGTTNSLNTYGYATVTLPP